MSKARSCSNALHLRASDSPICSVHREFKKNGAAVGCALTEHLQGIRYRAFFLPLFLPLLTALIAPFRAVFCGLI
jgi:hypothetical protein|eukprot:COSAG03_NODE_129_length_12045_cov_19.842625_2_plen_75_part_00